MISVTESFRKPKPCGGIALKSASTQQATGSKDFFDQTPDPAFLPAAAFSEFEYFRDILFAARLLKERLSVSGTFWPIAPLGFQGVESVCEVSWQLIQLRNFITQRFVTEDNVRRVWSA